MSMGFKCCQGSRRLARTGRFGTSPDAEVPSGQLHIRPALKSHRNKGSFTVTGVPLIPGFRNDVSFANAAAVFCYPAASLGIKWFYIRVRFVCVFSNLRHSCITWEQPISAHACRSGGLSSGMGTLDIGLG